MSWISRHKKSFRRYVNLLKELPIYLIDKYIIIDESICYYKKRKIVYDYKKLMENEYRNYVKEGKIKSASDFDNYFNPDLTLDVLFERNRDKADTLIQSALMEIGLRWDNRLKELFPGHDYSLMIYFDSEDSEWFLDFYNGSVKIESDERYKKILAITDLADLNKKA